MLLNNRGDEFMEQKSMTALVSAFSRAYHYMHNTVRVLDDSLAKKVLTDEEYEQIAINMSKGIKFFNPTFEGTRDQALRFIVDHQLSPSPLGRAAFAEQALKNVIRKGAKQYLIFAAGYDTFAYRQPKWATGIQIFEIDHHTMVVDKQKRMKALTQEKPSNLHYISGDLTKADWLKNLLSCGEFNPNKISFCSLLGISYYLTKPVFQNLISSISDIVPKGSSMVFDYPDEDTYTLKAGERAKKQAAMAMRANEKMLASYSSTEIEKTLQASNFSIQEHLVPEEITRQYFQKYNDANPEHAMTAFDNVNYCLAIKN